MYSKPISHLRYFGFVLLGGILSLATPLRSQAIDKDAVVRGIDASVAARDENVLAYNVTEHYAVYRNQDKDHPAAEVTVKTTYVKEKGKTYTILSESGSTVIRKQVLERVFDSEREMTQPANRSQAVITSANYTMNVTGQENIGGRNCLVVAITPRRSSPYLFTGTLWVDARDQSIVQLQGVASKSPSIVAGATEVSRTYDLVEGFPMASHATATSQSWLLGQTVIKIDYTGYQIMLRNAQTPSR